MNNKINITYIKLAIISIALLITSGCATIVSGTGQSISVVTEKEVTGAKCKLTDSKGGTWYVPETPGTATVRKGDGPMTIVCEKDGYKTATLMIDETLAGATFGNIILGGGIGILVDSMSGAAQKYPDQFIIWMEPAEWDSENAKTDWLKEKAAYEEKVAHKNKQPEQSNQDEQDTL